jgi:hypothetical protein
MKDWKQNDYKQWKKWQRQESPSSDPILFVVALVLNIAVWSAVITQLRG